MEMMIQELELWHVIPAIRREFALEMLKRGIKKVEISKFLGLTKSAVSQYLHNHRAINFRFNYKIKKKIQESVDKIINNVDSTAEIQSILKLLRENQNICKFHHSLEKIEKGCDICFR